MSDYLSESMELIPGSPTWRANFVPQTQQAIEAGVPVTCDWGDCDEPAVTFRNDVLGYGWLPVCEGCRMFPGRSWTVTIVRHAAASSGDEGRGGQHGPLERCEAD